jgi:serine/threonine protein kinase
LKPDNIILSPAGEVRLLDLGFASLPGLDDPTDGSIGGTIRYMAPELLRGAPANDRTEVFALGVTVYRLFNRGEFPFGQATSDPPIPGRRDLPPWLAQCMMRAIEGDADKRFADAAEFARALQEGLARGELARERRWAGRGPRTLHLWQGLAVVLAVALAVVLVTGWRP